MKIIQTQDIFLLPQGPDEAIGVTTNGCIKKDGTAVMGRGMALYADQRFGLSETLGRYLAEYGNRAFYLGVRQDRRTGHKMLIYAMFALDKLPDLCNNGVRGIWPRYCRRNAEI